MYLAGDVGGTKTRLGVFEPGAERPRPLVTREYPTEDFAGLPAMLSAFVKEFVNDRGSGPAFRRACFGVAGPVLAGTAEMTNVPWRVDAAAVADAVGLPRVSLINDVQAMAWAVPLLHQEELHTLQPGTRVEDGNMALIAAGTGLGEALIHNVGGRFIPSPGEGGHADFAARTEREIPLLRDLVRRYGRASVEHVVSGPGLLNIHRITHDGACTAVSGNEPDPSAAVSRTALAGTCAGCMAALDMFVEAYGAEAGNHALRSLSSGGLFVGGGIAPRILPALTDGRFMQAFCEKPPHRDLLSRMPVHVVLNEEAGLLGAAVFASRAG
jgi:glucokinase